MSPCADRLGWQATQQGAGHLTRALAFRGGMLQFRVAIRTPRDSVVQGRGQVTSSNYPYPSGSRVDQQQKTTVPPYWFVAEKQSAFSISGTFPSDEIGMIT